MSSERTGVVTGDTFRIEPVDPVVVQRWRVRYFAAAMAACASLVYFLIGLRVVSVIQNPEEQVGFGFAASAGFAIAAGGPDTPRSPQCGRAA